MASRRIGSLFAPRLKAAWSSNLSRMPYSPRYARYEAFGANLDPDEVAEAREWYRSFDPEKLPKGETTFSRSKGPGGQHVNKTETKATTAWSISSLMPGVPKLMRPSLRSSRFYTWGNDSLTLKAQTHRQREANLAENRDKLAEELKKIYQEVVPGESDPDKAKKHKAIADNFRERRMQEKKLLSSKKKSRRVSFDD